MKRQEGETGEFLRRRNLKREVMSRSSMMDLTFIFMFILFYFLFSIFFYFSIFRTTRVRVISHTVTSVTT